MTHPLEQEIINGLFYWDQIGPRWFRLLDRATQDVVGTVKHEYGNLRHPWTAVYRSADGATATRTYADKDTAVWFVEHCCKQYRIAA